MPRPGTYVILHIFSETRQLSYDAFQVFILRRRLPRQTPLWDGGPSWFRLGVRQLLFIMSILLWFTWPYLVMVGFSFLVCGIIFWLDEAILIPLVIVVGLGILAAGAASTANRVSRAIAAERQRNTWDYLLLLPYERYRLVLYSVAHTVQPHVMSFGFFAILLSTPLLFTQQTSALRWLLLAVLLGVEWAQVMALSVAMGVVFATQRERGLGVLLGLSFGIGLIVLRAGVGVLVGPRGSILAPVGALFVGPLSWIVAADRWRVGLAGGLLYLLALEEVVRRTFAWGVARAGE